MKLLPQYDHNFPNVGKATTEQILKLEDRHQFKKVGL